MSERVLVIQMAKLGDFIQSTPLLANVRRLRPGAAVHLAAEQPAVLAAARLSPLVDAVWPAGEGEGAVPSGLFDAVLVLNSHSRAAALAGRVEAKHYYGPRLEDGRLRFTPAQDFLMALMAADRPSGRFNLVDVWASLIPGAGPAPLVWPTVRPGATPAAPGFTVGLQLGSRNHLRRWPVEDFVRLVEELERLDVAVTPVLLGAAEERALGARFTRLRGEGRPLVNLMGATDLEQLGAVAAGLDLLITPDTGVMHLASAVGTPVLALFFGPAYGPETGPYGPGHLIYQALAECAPCREAAECRRRQCLERPDPGLAARLAARLLGGRADDGRPLDGPAGHRVWRTTLDEFGQTLRPLGRPPLAAGEVQALLATEAGRAVLRPGYTPDAARVAGWFADYAPPTRPLAADGRFFRALAENGFPQNSEAAGRFQAAATGLAAELGLEIA